MIFSTGVTSSFDNILRASETALLLRPQTQLSPFLNMQTFVLAPFYYHLSVFTCFNSFPDTLVHTAETKHSDKKTRWHITIRSSLSSQHLNLMTKSADVRSHAHYTACAEVCHSYISTTIIFNIYSGGCIYLNILCIVLKMLLCTKSLSSTFLRSALRAF